MNIDLGRQEDTEQQGWRWEFLDGKYLGNEIECSSHKVIGDTLRNLFCDEFGEGF